MTTAHADILSFGPLPDWAQPPQPVTAGTLRAKYDAAGADPINRDHWAESDLLSPDAALSKEVREKLRKRSRYEYANNAYCQGMISTLAAYVIGTAPTVQINTADRAWNERAERLFSEWAEAIDLGGKLRTMRAAQAYDGEAFAIFTNGSDHPIPLDLMLIEADRVTTPLTRVDERGLLYEPDGIVLDDAGKPTQYHVLDHHPGSQQAAGDFNAGRFYRAANIAHLFRPHRPEQHRGVPETAPALNLFLQLRRFTLATLTAAETSANIGAVLKTPANPMQGVTNVQAMEEFDIPRGTMMALPQGWDLGPMPSTQPSAQYEAFKRAIVAEAARALGLPFNVAAGDSSGYNYASGRLDHQAFFRKIQVDRHDIAHRVLNRVLALFLGQAVGRGLLPPIDNARRTDNGQRLIVPHVWGWDPLPHVDPTKEANADATRLTNGTLTEADYWSSRGRDWVEQQTQRATELGMSLDEYRAARRAQMFGTVPMTDGDDDEQ